MTPNWFIALPYEVGPWYERMLHTFPAPARVRVFHPSDLHFTLAFLGPVNERAARAAFAHHLEWPTGPIAVDLAEIRALGPARRFSALSALPDTGRDALETGIEVCRDSMRAAAGLAPETRAPLAHVTIARPGRRASGCEREAARVWATGLPVAGKSGHVHEIALFTWAEDRRQCLFRIVAKAPLGASPGPGSR